jgi:hypothetical protein
VATRIFPSDLPRYLREFAAGAPSDRRLERALRGFEGGPADRWRIDLIHEFWNTWSDVLEADERRGTPPGALRDLCDKAFRAASCALVVLGVREPLTAALAAYLAEHAEQPASQRPAKQPRLLEAPSKKRRRRGKPQS